MQAAMAPAIAQRPTAQIDAAAAPGGPRIRSSVSSWRYELKYAIPAHTISLLLADLTPCVNPDGRGDAVGEYGVDSIYFDSPDLTCFHAKLDGVPDRFKLRVRTYFAGRGGSRAACKLEIKERDAERVRKVVATVAAEEFVSLVPCLESFRLPDSSLLAASTALTRFLHRKTIHAMRPVVCVRYSRRAMIPRLDPRCRITVDSNLAGAPVSAGQGLDPCRSGTVPISDDAVLEIKTASNLPDWLARLIRKHRLQRCSLSKYALAITRCLGLEA